MPKSFPSPLPTTKTATRGISEALKNCFIFPKIACGAARFRFYSSLFPFVLVLF